MCVQIFRATQGLLIVILLISYAPSGTSQDHNFILTFSNWFYCEFMTFLNLHHSFQLRWVIGRLYEKSHTFIFILLYSHRLAPSTEERKTSSY